MKKLLIPWIAAGCLASGISAVAAVPIATGHTDVGIAYEAGAFDLHVHDENNDVEYSPSDALLVVRSGALQYSPGGDYSFLGPKGTPVWVLPANQNPDLLFLGIGAEELNPGDWIGNLSLTLKSVSGPGSFSLWSTDVLGRPQVWMNSSGGVTDADQVSVIPGSHGHYNWGFSAPGSYEIAFEAAGIHRMDGPQNSGPVTYQFQVVPEPHTWALLGFGFAALCWMGRNRRRTGAEFHAGFSVPGR